MRWDGKRWLSERVRHGPTCRDALSAANKWTARRKRREGRCYLGGGWR